MPQLATDVPSLIDDLAKSLKKDGKATVKVKTEANGDQELATNFLNLAAKSAGLDITVKSNKTSAIALISKNGDSPEKE